MKYLVIAANTVTGVSVESMNREILEGRLSAGWYPNIFESWPSPNPERWGDGVLIVRGEIVKPVPEVVKSWRF